MLFGLSRLYTALIGGAVGLAIILGAVLWHNHAVSAAYNRGKADEAEHIKAQAIDIKQKVDALTSNISNLIRDANNAENRRINASAQSILVRGPGRAVCSGNAGVPASPGGSQSADGTGGIALPRLSYPDGEQLIGMPFAPTVAFAEQHDTNRAEVLTWRDWYKRESEAFKPPAAPKKKHFLGIKL
jgi:hypothetical protein